MEKSKNGSISLKQGKATIIWQDKEQPFGIFFITSVARRALKKSRQGFYTNRIQSICKELDHGGIFAILSAKKQLEALSAGSDINRQFIKMICGWLGQIMMFKNVKTGAKPKNLFRDNFDTIFKKAA